MPQTGPLLARPALWRIQLAEIELMLKWLPRGSAAVGNAVLREKIALTRRYRKVVERFSRVPLKASQTNADYAVFVINLDHDVDRLAHCKKAFADCPVPVYRIPGVRARHLPALAATRLNGHKDNAGTLGCTLAHLAAWEAMLELQLERCLIVEDDAAPVIILPPKISALEIPDDFDLCFVNERTQWQPSEAALRELPDGMFVVAAVQALATLPAGQDAPGTDGYLLSAKGAQKLLSFYERDGFHGSPDWRLISYVLPLGGHAMFPEDSIAFREVGHFDQLGPDRLVAYSLFPCLVREAFSGSILHEENAEARRLRAIPLR